MKKMIALLLCAVLLCATLGCASAKQDTSPITMLVTQGNGFSYYEQLAEGIKNDLGIEVEFVYLLSQDTTSMTRLQFENNDLPADIVFTASKTDDALLKDSCVDLLSRSSVTSLFTRKALADCTTAEGNIYQLPITTRLIGITYNETLLNEMGWEVPTTFADMVDLKAKCDEAGIKFAVSDGVATGHGFNWLFHLMGAQWLSTPTGTRWLEDFLGGTETVDAFTAQSDYFKRWTEAGLWGSFHDEDWNGSKEFSQTRALFWYGLVNTVTSYDGQQYDDAGNDLGITLHDTYKSIPWISEDGTNNCYTAYDSCWVYVNKSLEAKNKSDKLKKAFQIIEYMASDKGIALVNGISADTYVATSDYAAGEDRLYAAYNGDVANGFIQPWYYNSFDMDSIVYTGEKVNAYIAGTGSYEEIFSTLTQYNTAHLNAETRVLTDFTDGLDLENTAKLLAIGCGTALAQTLADNGIADTVDAVLAPYTEDRMGMQAGCNVSVSNSVVYPGEFDASMVLTLEPTGVTTPVGIYMTGAEIKALTEKGFAPADRYINAETGISTFDESKYGPYPYVCVVKDGAKLDDEQTYLVATCEKFLSAADYAAFSDSGRVITDLTSPYLVKWGIETFCGAHETVTAKDLVF